MKKRLFIIDGHALCYRAYFAFIKNPLLSPDGRNVSAIFGFARMLLKLLKDQKPEYIAVAFDPPKKSFRFRMYPEYKANRQKMPDDLRAQIDGIIELVELLGIKKIVEDDFEADDVLGTAVEKFASDDTEVVLVTGDKDALQLVEDNVRVYANKKGITEYDILDADGVKEKFGVLPSQVVDYLAIVGDSSDNVPGIKGIGEKGALKLLTDFGSLDGIYENIGNVKGKTAQLLAENREMAYLSRDLVTIRRDVPLRFMLDDMKFSAVSSDAVELFRRLGMNSIIAEFFPDDQKLKPAEAPAPRHVEKKYQTIRDIKDLEAAIALLSKHDFISIDTETTSIHAVDAEIVGMSFAYDEGCGYYLPLVNAGLFGGDYPDRKTSIEKVKPLLENGKIKKIGQNIKYDIIVLKNEGVEVKGVWFDTMIASYLLNPTERRHNLDDLAEKFLNYKTITYAELVGTGKNAVPITEVPLDRISEYAIEDADITLRLYNVFKNMIEENSVADLFHNVEMPLVEVLADIEYTGVKINQKHFAELGKENAGLLQELEKNIYAEAGQEFNINSTRDLAVILFEKLGLKPLRKTKTGFSTDINVLESLMGKHKIIEHLVSYRTVAKLKNTYIDTLPGLVSKKTGRIHTSYNQAVAATGRLSSTDPNLQNIPVKDEFGKKIRAGFVPEKGCLMFSADYSQIELRLVAHLSGDKNMIRAFNDGTDIHNLTASSVFGVSMDDITPNMRRQSKIINFATIYGVSPYGLSQQADIGMKEAAEFIRKYFETYPGVRAYMDNMISFARENGYVETVLGRKRYIPEINSKTSFVREGAERVAINTPIQGTSADMIKLAMVNINHEIKSSGCGSRMIMQVHDELVFELDQDEKGWFTAMVKEKMESAIHLDVPVVVDVSIGKNWDEAH